MTQMLLSDEYQKISSTFSIPIILMNILLLLVVQKKEEDSRYFVIFSDISQKSFLQNTLLTPEIMTTILL
jgi:hypothetical protein